jgi:molybdate transport system substrate-binding protein
MRLARALVVLLLGCALVAGCSSSNVGATKPGGQPSVVSDGQTLTVLAASPLAEAFGTLGKIFEHNHPGVNVRFSFGSSTTLAAQVTQGAPADVLATADRRTMHGVVSANANRSKPRLFASNKLVLAVPRGNPDHVLGIHDLNRKDVAYLMCVTSAPCGALAKKLLLINHVTAYPASKEIDVKSVLSKLELAEADAGLVYASDVHAAQGMVRALPILHSGEHRNLYPIVVLAGTKHPVLARAWVKLVRSQTGQKVLQAAGFGAP